MNTRQAIGDVVTFAWGEQELTGTVIDKRTFAGMTRYGVRVRPDRYGCGRVYYVWSEYIRAAK